MAQGPTHEQIDAAEWSTVTTSKDKSAGEVTISKSQIAGVDCFRGRTTIAGVGSQSLLEAAMDIEGAVEWSDAGLSDGKVLSRSEDHMSYYQVLDVPDWTLSSDRFWFLRGKVHRSDDQLAFRWVPLDAGGPHTEAYAAVRAEHPSAIEPPINTGAWFFDHVGDQVQVTYVICTQSGSLPRIVQNGATRKTLPATMGDVIRQARKLEE